MGPLFRLKRGTVVEKPTVKKLCVSSYVYPGPIFISGYCLAISSCKPASAAAYCARERRTSKRFKTAFRWTSSGKKDSALGGVSMLGHENWASRSRKDCQLCLGKLDPRQVHILSRYLPSREYLLQDIYLVSPRLCFGTKQLQGLRRKDVIQQRGTNSAADGPSRICQIESSCLIETACGLDAVSALAGGFDGNGKIQCQQVRGRDAGHNT